jgi:hypothetical protein
MLPLQLPTQRAAAARNTCCCHQIPAAHMQAFTLTGVSCWRCGKRGHLTKDCSEPDARPCFFCARYGHEGPDCPDSKCDALSASSVTAVSAAAGVCLSAERAVAVSPVHQPCEQPFYACVHVCDSFHLLSLLLMSIHSILRLEFCVPVCVRRDLLQLQAAGSQAGGLPL